MEVLLICLRQLSECYRLQRRIRIISILIRRTLLYAALSATLALVYTGTVLLLQELFRALSGENSTLAVVASTLVIAALFSPLRHRLQVVIDRRFYRRRYDVEQALHAFGARLRDQVDLAQLEDHLVEVVEWTVQPEFVSLWLPEKNGQQTKKRPVGGS